MRTVLTRCQSCGRNVLCRRNSKGKAPRGENNQVCSRNKMLIWVLRAMWTESRQQKVAWRGRQGPAQQGFLNHGGCLHFIPLQKTIRGFQQSSGLWGYTIVKARCSVGKVWESAVWESGGEVRAEGRREELMMSRTGRGRTTTTSDEGRQEGEACVSGEQVWLREPTH